MKLAVIVQARLSSRRLPGKVLAPIGPHPLLGLLLARLRHATDLPPVIVATSTESSDDQVADYAQAQGVDCCRGSLEQVAQRYATVIATYGLTAFVRVCADSPWLDPRLIQRAIALYQPGVVDLVSNVLPRTFPKGQSIELVDASCFMAALPRFETAADFEHVTAYFHRQRDAFRIRTFSHTHDCSKETMTVDEPADLALSNRLYAALMRPYWTYGWEELLALQQQLATT